MTAVPWSRRSRARRRRTRAGAAGQRRRERRGLLLRPVLHLVVAAGVLPLPLLLTSGQLLPAALVLALVLAGWASAALLVARAGLEEQSRDRTRAAALEHGEGVVVRVYEDWLRAEAERGVLDLERWRRTHRP